MKMCNCKGLFGLLAFGLVASPSLGVTFTTINNAGSGSEPDLWEVLDVIAPIGGGWGSTSDLSTNTSGRRVSDSIDQIRQDGTVDISATGLWWGGVGSAPGDTNTQDFRWTGNLDGSGLNATGIDVNSLGDNNDPGASLFVGGDGKFIVADEAGTTTAWSLESLNSGNLTDRVVTFDVSGLDVYQWESGNLGAEVTTLIRSSSETGPAYLLAFDPGSDRDFQDMLVLLEGADPVPAPGAAVLAMIGLGVTHRVRRRRAA